MLEIYLNGVKLPLKSGTRLKKVLKQLPTLMGALTEGEVKIIYKTELPLESEQIHQIEAI